MTLDDTSLSHKSHASVLCGTIAVSDLDRSVQLYSKMLDYIVLELGNVNASQAASWLTPGVSGAKYALLRPSEQNDTFLRLVETREQPTEKPAATLGWTAFEYTVKDVFALARRLESSDFDIIGPPRKVDGFSAFIPMQVLGPDGEGLFLNQVLEDEPDTDLPRARCWVDRLFIAVTAATERSKTFEVLAQQLAIDEGETHTIRYSFINKAFNLPAETKHTLSMLKDGRVPLIQIDQHPVAATAKETANVGDSLILPGNAIVTLLVDNLASLAINDAASNRQDDPLYQGRASCCIKTPDGALIELIERE